MLNIIFLGGEDVSARIDIAQLLKQKGCNVSIIGSEDSSIFEASGIPYQKIRINRELNIIDDIKTILNIRKILKNQKEKTVVHAFDTKLIIYLPFAAIGLKNIKTVRTINGMGRVFSGDSMKHKLFQKAYVLIQSIIKNKVDYTIFQNTDNFKYFRNKNIVNTSSSKIVKGSGINIQKFQSFVPDELKQELRQELQIDAHLPTVILISRLIKQKGVYEYLQAAKYCNEKIKRFNFLLVGQIDTKEDAVSFDEIRRYSDYVNYIGRRNDVKELLSISDIFVLPTYYSEGIPRVLLEASIMRLALVSTDMPGCNDVVIDDFNGKIVKIKSSEDLAEKLNFLVSDNQLLQIMKENSFTHVQQFSLDKVASDCLNIYKELIAK